MRIVLTGGGTGGHVFPLIAIARELRQQLPNAELRFIGPAAFGANALERENVVVRGIIAGKLPRYPTPRLLLELFKIPAGFVIAFWELYWFMPDVVFGKGGYGMVPVVAVAWLFRIPIVIHESDAVAGLATRICARFAKKVLLSFPVTAALPRPIQERTHVVGNPVRKTLTQGNRQRAQQRFHLALKPVVLVLGGSQGAEELNSLMVQIAPQLATETEVIHQTGALVADRFAREIALVLEPYPDTLRFYHVVPFLDEEALADAYAVATVVVSRAGAGSIFELALTGLPTIFLPLKSAAAHHQERNATILTDLGAALTLSGANLAPHLLLGSVERLLQDDAAREVLRTRFRAFAKPDAAADIAATTIRLGQKKS
ncbi:MAG: UDP-N-acetylglucosamine--N-acetylmuramyl-(pentapeptide) pyrophosphoryl-undecaprenol N-acetylglucosamine transferase [Candidatus Terrybacteria bacterium]|nr:UDP-N-acetylglucosamine--N-acetylmuramyl-(pentapeptide) pyrophosphoryl-undecaprenol N-acetylglucosamine transferase [Candidatus Terrybacteria bacterium]